MSGAVYTPKGTYLLEIHNESCVGALLVLKKNLLVSDLLDLNVNSIVGAKIDTIEYYEPTLATTGQIFKFYVDEWNLVMTELLYEPETKRFSVYAMEEIND